MKVKHQCAKKVVSDSLGLVDFAIGLVIFVLNLPEGQVLYFGKIQITEAGIRTFRTHGCFVPTRFVPKVEMIRTQR